ARSDRRAAAGADPAILPGPHRRPGRGHHGQIGRRGAGAAASGAGLTGTRAAGKGRKLTPEGQRMEALAERLRTVEPMAPSPAAKIRGWNLVSAAVQQSAMVRSRGHSVKRLALSAMDDQLGDAAALVKAEKGTDPAIAADLENRLLQAIATHDGQLARLQGQVTNPAAQSAILKARDRAAQAVQVAQTSNNNGNPSPNGKGSGNASASPHPTPKH